MRKFGVKVSGVVVALIVLFLVAGLVFVLLGGLARGREVVRRASCQNNLKQMGLVYRMYAQEDRDGRYPAMSLLGFEKSDGGLHMTFNFGPSMGSIFPEYMTDPVALICPSDPFTSVDYFQSEEGWVLTEWRSPEEGGPLTLNGTPCTDPRACIHAVDNSYWYWGYVFDKLDDEHGKTPVTRLSDAMTAHGLTPADHMSELLAAHGVRPPYEGSPTQLVQAFEEILLERALPALAAGDLEALNLAADADVPVTLGNASTETVHRLREGVERFFITDIGNPDAASKAQAQILVMFEAIGVTALDRGILMFNHVPGGCNVLFMDGHVEFIGFQERAPVLNSVANFAAAVLRR